MVEYVNPYKTPQHERHVREGNCASIHRSKAWCSGKRYHTGLHWSLRLEKSGDVTRVHWNNSEVHQVPAHK